MNHRRIRNLLLLALAGFLCYRAAIFLIHKLDLRPHLDRVSLKANKVLIGGTMTRYCDQCHSDPAQDFHYRDWQFGNSYSEILRSIGHGYPDAGMPAFDTILSDRKMRRIAHYIINLSEQEADEDFLLDRQELPEIFESATGLHYRVDTVVCDAEIRIPWSVEFLPDRDLIVTSRDGALFRYDAENGLRQVTGTPEVYAAGQGGLLDAAVHPDFTENGLVFLSYSVSNGRSSTTVVMRARLTDTDLAEQEVIFTAEPWRTIGGFEFGSRLLIDQDGLLYITVGHRSVKDPWISSLDNDLGKVHRINIDGSVPADNPFLGRQDARPSIFSFGHRNPQGLALDTVNGIIWSGEHGPRGGDEINILRSGADYGWPQYTYGTNYDGSLISLKTQAEGIEDPVHYWVPAIAPSGMDIITGNRYPGWEGDLLVASLKYDHISRLDIDSMHVIDEEPLASGIGRVRDVRMAPDGYVYFTVEGLADYAVRKGKPGCVFRLLAVD